MVKHAIESGIEFNKVEESLDTPDVRALLRLASSSSVVLLKNGALADKSLRLPIKVSKDSTPTIAVIGPNAKRANISGGGSATLRPTYTVSPLDGILNVVAELGGDPSKVTYSLGTMTQRYLPLVDPYITQPDDATIQGGKFEFWNESPSDTYLTPSSVVLESILPEAVWSTTAARAHAFMIDGVVCSHFS